MINPMLSAFRNAGGGDDEDDEEDEDEALFNEGGDNVQIARFDSASPDIKAQGDSAEIHQSVLGVRERDNVNNIDLDPTK